MGSPRGVFGLQKPIESLIFSSFFAYGEERCRRRRFCLSANDLSAKKPYASKGGACLVH